MDQFTIKDSGERQTFTSGMVRDTGAGKVRYNRVLHGPMFKRWAAHLQKGAQKYPDVAPGVPNWTLASGEAEVQRFKESALGHMIDWLEGKVDEDHAAGVFFNINGAEDVKAKLAKDAAFEKFEPAHAACDEGSFDVSDIERVTGKECCPATPLNPVPMPEFGPPYPVRQYAGFSQFSRY